VAVGEAGECMGAVAAADDEAEMGVTYVVEEATEADAAAAKAACECGGLYKLMLCRERVAAGGVADVASGGGGGCCKPAEAKVSDNGFLESYAGFGGG
jgi:hypothetical protein